MEHARETVEFARQQQGLIPPLRHSSFIFSCHSCTNWKTFVATCDRGVCESHRRLKPMLKPFVRMPRQKPLQHTARLSHTLDGSLCKHGGKQRQAHQGTMLN